ncbi:MAG TPA: NAD(P)/FAD-dependent oxidoreductase, partial [Gemmatimonadales bacterium]
MGSSTAASPDVLVAGAGPAGSAVAIRLARAGRRVLLVDRAAFPRDKPCADYLSPGALRALGALGLRERVEALGTALEGIAVETVTGSRLEGRFAEAGAEPRERHGCCLPRRELDALLVGAARDAGAELAERTVVEALVHEDGGVGGAVVRDAAGRRRLVRARLTIGADGLRSVVARCIGGRRHSVPRRVAFVGHFEAGADAKVAHMVVGASGYAGINPLGGGISNVALVVPAPLAARARGDAEGFMRSELAALPGLGAAIARGRIVRKVLVTGPFAARSRRIVTGGAALVGDAADFFDPFTGEGVCSALR